MVADKKKREEEFFLCRRRRSISQVSPSAHTYSRFAKNDRWLPIHTFMPTRMMRIVAIRSPPPPQKQVDVMEKESTVRDLIGDVCVQKCAWERNGRGKKTNKHWLHFYSIPLTWREKKPESELRVSSFTHSNSFVKSKQMFSLPERSCGERYTISGWPSKNAFDLFD